jgi:hypothetical protein
MRCDHNPTGLLIIRAWIEPGSSSPLRAQIRLTTDLSAGFDRSLTVTQQDAIVTAVRAWVSEMLAGSHGVTNHSDNPER